MQTLYLETSGYMVVGLSESKRLIYIPYHFDKLIESVRKDEYNLVGTPLIKNEIKEIMPLLKEM